MEPSKTAIFNGRLTDWKKERREGARKQANKKANAFEQTTNEGRNKEQSKAKQTMKTASFHKQAE